MDASKRFVVDAGQGEGWQLRQTQARLQRRQTDETLFALANGSLGVRGGLEEDGRGGEGCFLAGVFERHRIHYHERFPGFARNSDVRVPVADGCRIGVHLDGERLDLDACEWLDFERTLDLRHGVLRRRLRLRTPRGITLQIDSERLVAFDRDVLAIRYRVASVDFAGRLQLESTIEAGRRPASQGDDPRIGAAGGDALQPLAHAAAEAGASLAQRTAYSGIAVACAQRHRLSKGLRFVDAQAEATRACQRYQAELVPGAAVELEKFVAYASGDADAEAGCTALVDAAAQAADAAAQRGHAAFAQAQAAWQQAFWDAAAIDIDGDDDSRLALRFNLFHLFQSSSRDPAHGTAAKGLTGEGYEGHCFWDTEAFVLPVMAFTAPATARAMLLYRHRKLDAARANARELNHPRGALYPWRTIAGAECSAHYPTGSAAYHINAAIAHAIGLYLDASGDQAFLLEAGAEMLFETARIWPQVGHFDPLRDGAFGIHGVTGPDEYDVLVNNNFYTNRTAQRHLQRAVAVWDALRATHRRELETLASRLALQQEEVDQWRRIAEAMQLHVDPHLDIYAQDDSFLHKPRWPHADARSGRPLLLDYHPLTIFRHQVGKQADAVMAFALAGDGLDPLRKRRSFDYYEAVTTHDSTLSAAVHGIVAAEAGHPDKAWRHFRDALRVDLDDLHHNTAHGVHMAAMAGSWLGLAWGFAGLRVVDGELRFAPMLPEGWNRYGFGLHWRGRRLRVEVDGTGARYALLDGAPLQIRHAGQPLELASATPAAVALVDAGAALRAQVFPRACKALVFDLDGVLTDTASTHYHAWKRLADEIGVPFDREVNERLKGVDRMASLEIILERASRAYSAEEKQALAERKNAHYVAEIDKFGPADLFDGVERLLDAARARGLKLGLASASRNAPLLLQRLGIAARFDYVADAARIARAKPDPEIFLDVAAALGVPPALCIGIEDAAAGIAAIHAAGMAAIGIGDATALMQADAVLPSLSQLQLEDYVAE
ncbi:MAG: beta-phosphoglucomutase [Pseudoxanthomonas sp.]